MNEITTTAAAHNFCVEDFLHMYRYACSSAHGNPDISATQILHLAQMMGPNGIRIVWLPNKSVQDVEYKPQFKQNQSATSEKMYEKI